MKNNLVAVPVFVVLFLFFSPLCFASKWLESYTSAPVYQHFEKGYCIEYTSNNVRLVPRLVKAANLAISTIETSTSGKLPENIGIFIFPSSEAYLVYVQNPSCASVVCQSLSILCNPDCFHQLTSMDFYDAVIHELAHIYNCGNCPVGMPRWLDEGIACLFEEKYKIVNMDQLLNADPLFEMVDRVNDQILNYPKALSVVKYILKNDFNNDFPAFLASICLDDGSVMKTLYRDTQSLNILEMQWRAEISPK